MTATDEIASGIAAAIGDKARARMLYCLLDGHARTATELAVVAAVTPSTASVHLTRLRDARLVALQAQGRHRYYRLSSPQVARVLEGLAVLAGGREEFNSKAPLWLRSARTCYDHMAGALGVAIHDRLLAREWIVAAGRGYDLTAKGGEHFASLGLDVTELQSLRRRFAYPCLDWSERRPHVGGALAASLLALFQRKRWVTADLNSRALCVTNAGKRELLARFDVSC